MQRQQRANDAALIAIEAPLKAKAGANYVALSKSIEGASKVPVAKEGNATPDYGYHSAISREQNAVKWVQVDLGQHTAIDHVTLLPCYDDFNNIGAGFGFPVRFKIEIE